MAEIRFFSAAGRVLYGKIVGKNLRGFEPVMLPVRAVWTSDVHVRSIHIPPGFESIRPTMRDADQSDRH